MAQPDNSLPPRPASVPSDARWQPDYDWMHGALDEEGRAHGVHRSWTRDGVLHAEVTYEHGAQHGAHRTFHADGTLAHEATWARGVMMDSQCYRSEQPTPEPFPPVAPGVWSVRSCTRDGKTNTTIRYFLRDGVECGPDARPLPARPPHVARDARWFPDLERWVDGEIERVTNAEVGRWRWWSPDGVLRHEELRDARGEPTQIVDYTPAGALQCRTTRDAVGETRDHYFLDGKLAARRRDDPSGRAIYKASWHRDGALHEEIERVFEGDRLARVTERGRTGALVFEARAEGAAMACMLYRDTGGVLASGGIADGKLAGTWRIFDEGGAVRREVDASALALEHAVTGEGLAWRLGEALFASERDTPAQPAELAGVEREPWDPALPWPRLLQAAVSPDPLVQGYALAVIDRQIDAGAPALLARVVPYLARLLAHPGADRARLYATIEACAAHPPSLAAAWPYLFAAFAQATPDERMHILELARLAPDARPGLVELSRRDADPGMRACAIEALTAQAGYPLADVLPALTDREPAVRVAAAIAIGCTRGPESPREVVTVLADALRSWREVANRFASLPHLDGHMLGWIALALGSIRSVDARSLAQLLCAPFDEVDPASAVMYARGLLMLAFGPGERPFAKRFVDILDTLARSKQLWLGQAAALEVLDRWNLPREPRALAALVAKLRGAADPEAVMQRAGHGLRRR
jgi:hypothetical protein